MDRADGVIRPVDHYDLAFSQANRQMGVIEGLVWDEFVRKFGGDYERIGENVPVWLDPPEKRDVLKPSKRVLVSPPSHRVDAIAGDVSCVELIEVKEVGNMTAIGQLLTYRMLFLRTYWGYQRLAMRLVCLRAPAPIVFACGRLEIEVTEIGESIAGEVKRIRMGKSKLRVSDQG